MKYLLDVVASFLVFFGLGLVMTAWIGGLVFILEISLSSDAWWSYIIGPAYAALSLAIWSVIDEAMN